MEIAERRLSIAQHSIAVRVYFQSISFPLLPVPARGAITYLIAMSSHMWDQHNAGVGQKARMNFWLILEHVEPAAAHFSTRKCLHERVLIHHCAAGCVHDHYAVLHL